MNHHALRDAYERWLQKAGSRPGSLEVPLERLDALVGREGSEADRLRTLDVVMSSAEGRREFEVAWAASRAAAEYGKTKRPSIMRAWGLAAAALLLVSAGAGTAWVRSRSPGSTAELLRGVESPLPLVAPRDNAVPQRGVRFVWGGVATAQEYTLVVVDTAGHEVFARTTRDTSALLADSITLTAGAQYLWWVQAAMPDGSTVSAVTERIRIKR